MSQPLKFFCIAYYFKGIEFLKACKSAGNKVFLLTKKSMEDKPWPKEAIDEFFYTDDDSNTPENLDSIAKGFSWLMRREKVDRIVALDDYDVEKAAYLREEFRISGMGVTTAKFFRDKLSMRMQAASNSITVPPFSALFNDDEINKFIQLVPAPWVIKPRSEATAIGIKKVNNGEELWNAINSLGEDRFNYLVEQFKPGDVYHVDSLMVDGKVVFSAVSQYQFKYL